MPIFNIGATENILEIFKPYSIISVSHEIREGSPSILINIQLDPERIAKFYMPEFYDKLFEDFISEINDQN